MVTHLRRAAAAALIAALPAAAQGQSWVLGAGVTIYDRGSTGSAVVELHGAPLARIGTAEVTVAAAAIADGFGAGWVGLGAALFAPLGGRWFLEASIMPGLHAVGDRDSRLGGAFQVRSLLGIGYRFGEGRTVSLALHHRSNADLRDYNPGEETIGLRFRFEF